MSYVLSQLGLFGTPEGDYNSSLEVEATGTSDGSSSGSNVQEAETYTTLGLAGFGVSYPLHLTSTTPTAQGLAQGVAIVDGQSTTLANGVGEANGTSTVEGYYGIPDYLTTLGLFGLPRSHPMYLDPTSASGEAVGSAFGTSTVYGEADVALIEDIGDPDNVTLGSVSIEAAATIATNVLNYTPTGGLTFGGEVPRLKGFTYVTAGGISFAGAGRALKSRTISPSTASPLRFAGSASVGTTIKYYTYTPSGGAVFSGTGSVQFFKNYGPGAGAKVRRSRRISFATKSYSRG